MESRLRTWTTVGLVAATVGTAGVLTLWKPARAEQAPATPPLEAQFGGPVPGEAGGGGGFGGGGFGGGGAVGGPGFPGGCPGGPGFALAGGGGQQMTVTGSTVYVLRGNQLLSFDARTLKLIAQAELPAPRPPQFQPGGPGFPGAGGQGGFGGGGAAPGGRPRPTPEPQPR